MNTYPMHKKISILLLLSGLSLTATQAFASVYQTWTGPYFGLSVGWGDGDIHVIDRSNNPNSSLQVFPGTTATSVTSSQSTAKLSGDMTGGLANLFVGYNYQWMAHPCWVSGGQLEGTFFNQIVLPAEGQNYTSSFTTNNNNGVVTTNTSRFYNTLTVSDSINTMFTFLARGGYLVQPNMLLYVLAGGVEANFALPSNVLLGLKGDRNKWVLGYTVGTGLEYIITNHWSVRGEYRFLQFNVNRHLSSNGANSEVEGGDTTFFFSSNFGNTTHLNSHVNFNMGSIAVVYGFC